MRSRTGRLHRKLSLLRLPIAGAGLLDVRHRASVVFKLEYNRVLPDALLGGNLDVYQSRVAVSF